MALGVIGRPLVRLEDAAPLRGEARYLADLDFPGMCHAVVLRSEHAHGRVIRIDATAARAAQGVLTVLLPDDPDVRALGVIPFELPPPRATLEAARAVCQPVVARGVVRHVGEPVALVVARSLNEALDAAERVVVEIAPLPAVVDPAGALVVGAPVLHGALGTNRLFRFEAGDRAATEAAFARADRIARLDLVNNRLVANPMEPRGAIGRFDPASGGYTLHVSSNKPHLLQGVIARDVLGIPVEKLRVVAPAMGGSFGAKNHVYPEQILVLLAARRIGRSVAWIASRQETFLSDAQGRDQVSRAELALDGDGRFLAIRATTVAALGAWLSPRAVVPPQAGGRVMTGMYRIPAAHLVVDAVMTNTVPTAPYRGAGQPEIMYLLERLVEEAARVSGLPPEEIRRRNLVPAAAVPFTNALGTTCDSGDFPHLLERALALSDWRGFAGRRAASEARGFRRGIGLSLTLEACGFGRAMDETARITLDSAGGAEVLIGTMSSGQGHATAYAQIVAEVLGIAPERVSVVQGDTSRIATGSGTGASRSITVGGSALLLAARDLLGAAREEAGRLLQAPPVELEFASGSFTAPGGLARVGLAEIARSRGGTLAASHHFAPVAYTFPAGAHVAEVEIDPQTGVVRLVAYTLVHDVGRAINPAIVRGQLVGGVVQGIGQALGERVAFDSSGQILSASFMDYAMPRADDLPAFQVELVETLSPANPLGAKSCGEAGTTAAPPAVMGAVLDALVRERVRHLDMPATPERVWQAIEAARAGREGRAS